MPCIAAAVFATTRMTNRWHAVFFSMPPHATRWHIATWFITQAQNGRSFIDVEDAGANKDAMVAELAYQIGTSLWQTECCHEQALQYLAYALQLFPRSITYRHAYQRSRAVLALGKY